MAIALQADTRTACVSLMTDFNETMTPPVLRQIYRARVADVKAPCAFVDRMTDELIDFLAPAIFQHVTTAEVVVLHGLFDHGEAVDQRDRFVDGFTDWVRTRFHAAGANSLIRIRRLTDDPEYIPTWLPEAKRLTYFATIVTVEVEATD